MTRFLLDTDVLSLFAKVGALPLLCRLLGLQRLPVTTGVFNEIIAPLEYGYDFPRQVLALAEIELLAADEVSTFEALRLEGKVSASDAELIAICQRRSWVYVTMDRVAARCAENLGVRTVDLYALLKAAWAGGLRDKDELQALMDQMERADRTTFPFRDELINGAG